MKKSAGDPHLPDEARGRGEDAPPRRRGHRRAQSAGAERAVWFVRIDTVHPGDKDGRKGVRVVKAYHPAGAEHRTVEKWTPIIGQGDK